MSFSFDKLLAAFGNVRAMERTHIDNHTEDIIKSIKDEHFAISEQNVMYAGIDELGGYYFLKTIIVGAFKIKTMKGATLSLVSNDFELKLITDMDEFESEYSNVSNRYVTRIDFQVEEDDVSKINPAILESLTLKAKKHHIEFKIATH